MSTRCGICYSVSQRGQRGAGALLPWQTLSITLIRTITLTLKGQSVLDTDSTLGYWTQPCSEPSDAHRRRCGAQVPAPQRLPPPAATTQCRPTRSRRTGWLRRPGRRTPRRRRSPPAAATQRCWWHLLALRILAARCAASEMKDLLLAIERTQALQALECCPNIGRASQ